jgi:hypothetical protein
LSLVRFQVLVAIGLQGKPIHEGVVGMAAGSLGAQAIRNIHGAHHRFASG